MKRLLKYLVHITFIVYLYLLFIVLFDRPSGTEKLPIMVYLSYSVNLIPFKTIIEYTLALFDGSMGIGTAIDNLSANLLVFMPMGIYLPYYFRNKLTLKQCFLILIGMVFSVEILQLILRKGTFDIDDIILNVLGGMIGYLIFKSEFIQKIYNRLFVE